ncbi:MAG: phosphate ABC transporter substrate-binding protein [Chlorobiaceae bacterium]|nr:phosphate ABC transporter substrate-binding protein [Chlorobiaceae bacterium]
MTSRIFRLVFLSFFAMLPAARAAVPAIALDGSTTVGPIAKSFAAYFMKKYGVPVTVSESGSGNGAKSLINGSCTIATMSRAMKDKESAAARKKGFEPVSHVIALDGLAIVVYPGNPVSSLSRAQISAIYRGTIRNWRQVGGPDVPIVVIQRESNSGTQEAFKNLVIGKGVPISGRAETQSSNGAVKNRVSATPSAIGFLGLGYLDQSVKAVAVDGVVPSVKTVKNHTYPVTRPLFFYTAGQPSGYVQKFVELSDTAEGREIIKELGFISL